MKNDKTTLPKDSPRLAFVFSSLMLVVLLAALDQTIVSTALPTITGELGGLAYLSWVVTGYLLATTVVTPLYGKLGDLYGRKLMLQAGIALFLLGSVLSGLAQNMLQLILFRAVQGLGGGGLIVTAMAVVAEVVPPRERGRYQGIFGAVFGVATLVGPLLGGFVVDHLSWRWIFYINAPLGLLALVIIGVVFRAPPKRQPQPIDYAGAILLSGALSSAVLFASVGGAVLPWTSLPVIGLGIGALALTLGFIAAERRARSPILPLQLFAEPVFTVAAALGFIVGIAMFGSITYLPVYLQVVQGASPSISGLLLAPLMGGLVVTSTLSGQLISRLGRYRPFPIVGTALMTLGLYLLSRLDAEAAAWVAPLYMLILGFGMGMVMQVLILAVQNAVEFQHLGVATSGNAMFRQVGGSVGVSLFGAIFAGQLLEGLARLVSPDIELPTAPDPATIAGLPPAVRDAYAHAVTDALQPVFLMATGLAAIGFLLSWRLQELPLSKAVASSGLAGTFLLPRDADSLTELERIVDTLSRRENSWQVYQRLAAQAGVRVSPQALWLLARLEERQPIPAQTLEEELNLSRDAVAEPLAMLRGRRLIGLRSGNIALTRSGRQALERVWEARRRNLEELLSGWHPEQHAAVEELIRRLARNLVREMPRLP
jgi:EmrB/QacA subfamily drug resistance transporter